MKFWILCGTQAAFSPNDIGISLYPTIRGLQKMPHLCDFANEYFDKSNTRNDLFVCLIEGIYDTYLD